MARTITYQQAINEALDQEMARDPGVILMGEDVAGGQGTDGESDAWGGPFGTTKGLYPKYGDRVMDTPITESAFVAAAVGGIPEMVGNGDFAKLVTTRNQSDFADAVEWVLDHRDETATITKQASAHVDSQYTREKMVEAHSRLYTELLNNAVRAYRKER